ncbi:MAG: ion channel [Acidocella sp.]|uniref:ion channel n=1 Tax=Acidocella sp. TaxID=50710 RepID=UPI003FD784AA
MSYIHRIRRRRISPDDIRDRPPTDVPLHRVHMFERKGEESVLRVGLEENWLGDLYHKTLVVGWPTFIFVSVGLYLLANILFALLYMLQPAGVETARPGHFLDFFFFSVQTITTVGYGKLIPVSLYSNSIMTLESLSGILFNALVTGLGFARFSRPRARVLFSNVAVISRQDGKTTLSVRLANKRRSTMLSADVEATFVHLVRTKEGKALRRYDSLKLTKQHTPVFSLTFIAEHVLDETSPLYGATKASLVEGEAEVIITVTGLDNTTSQSVHASAAYGAENIIWNRRFVDVVGYTDDGYRVIDYRRFHETEMGEQPPPEVIAEKTIALA